MNALNVSFLPLSYAMLSTFNFFLVINVSSGRAFSPVSTSIGCGTMSPDLEVDIGGVDVNVGLACAPERHLGVDGGVRLAPVALISYNIESITHEGSEHSHYAQTGKVALISYKKKNMFQRLQRTHYAQTGKTAHIRYNSERTVTNTPNIFVTRRENKVAFINDNRKEKVPSL